MSLAEIAEFGVVDQIDPECDPAAIEAAAALTASLRASLEVEAFKAQTWPTVEFAQRLVRAGDEHAEVLLRRLVEQVGEGKLEEASETSTALAGYCLARQAQLDPVQAAALHREEAERIERHVAAHPQAASRIMERRSRIVTARRRYEAHGPVPVLLVRARSSLPGQRRRARRSSHRCRSPGRPGRLADDDPADPVVLRGRR